MVVALARDDSPGTAPSDPRPERSERNLEPLTETSEGSGRPRLVERPRVLIAEDDAAVSSTLSEILATEGYAVTTASDGEDALAKLESEPVDILVLDLHMPRLDGIGVLEQVDAPPPLVLVHSAFEHYSPQQLRQKHGRKIFRYLRKPVAPPELMTALREAVTELERMDGN